MHVSDALADPLVKAESHISAVIGDPGTSYWLKDALSRSLDRDPVDSVNDAEALHELLEARATALFDKLLGEPSLAAALRR